ncbi:hypothetical protein HCH_06369 [Hahella chejuensis KCTC 2396]|uniref:Uncharacterized protein n=1 Tax=Hahella chejuensis (strain KCTC 2396) TaxID=349521 RepID=Q2S8L0_HAHCH|nr:hypothetical protein [Hahella chejuensis]ABC33014.1 hypothetical protein HCH_06369 [Hahella chejuensis KCTC 2396]
MFAFQDCITSIKYLAKISDYEGTHCQKIDKCCQEYGFNHYNDLRSGLPELPTDRFANISLTLMRKYCAAVKPNLDTAYYEFHATPGPKIAKIAFYSYWIGWDKKGREVREPLALDGKESVDGLRELLKRPVYVVENSQQLTAWLCNWYGVALVSEELAHDSFREKFDRQRLVDENVNMALVRAQRENYDDNMAT